MVSLMFAMLGFLPLAGTTQNYEQLSWLAQLGPVPFILRCLVGVLGLLMAWSIFLTLVENHDSKQ